MNAPSHSCVDMAVLAIASFHLPYVHKHKTHIGSSSNLPLTYASHGMYHLIANYVDTAARTHITLILIKNIFLPHVHNYKVISYQAVCLSHSMTNGCTISQLCRHGSTCISLIPSRVSSKQVWGGKLDMVVWHV